MTYIVLAAVLLLMALVWSWRQNMQSSATPEELMKMYVPVDIDAFRALASSSHGSFLRNHLPREVRKQLEQQRQRLIIRYLATMSHNAALLMKLGELARRSSNSHAQAAGQLLVQRALQCQVLSLIARFHCTSRLYLGVDADLALQKYARMVDTFKIVTTLEAPHPIPLGSSG